MRKQQNSVTFASIRASIIRQLSNRQFWRDTSLLMLANVIVTGIGFDSHANNGVVVA